MKVLTKKWAEKHEQLRALVCGEDKIGLTPFAEKLLNEVEVEADKAKNLTEIAQNRLPEEFILDDVVGQFAYEEYSIGKDYFIDVGGYQICIENFEILQRENFKINKFEHDNPLALWTMLYSAELHYVSNENFELHLLFVNGDNHSNKQFWYFTLKGTNIKYLNQP